jgi:uncharacterized repeat protein (TIGR03803 family)
MKILRVVCVLGGFLFLVLSMLAQTFTTLHTFCSQSGCSDGVLSSAGLVQGFSGNFYGVTNYGGVNNDGTVFEITPSGTLTTLHSFDFTDGYLPEAPLVQAVNGNLFGLTSSGGADVAGTVFKITAGGKLTTLESFCSTGCPNGYVSFGGLVQATNGNFYGATGFGGTNYEGAVFEITATGKLTTLYSFCSQSGCTDGSYPYEALVEGTDGNFYGTTTLGGAHGDGTVFKITPTGALTTLHSFDGTDGTHPTAGLIQGTNGNFYGTTCGSGPACNGFTSGNGTVFEITPSGRLRTLHSFDGTDGANPFGGVVEGTDGSFYGTTTLGGAHGEGTVFKIGHGDTLTTLYSFCSQGGCADGYYPYGGLLQGTDGIFYGTTEQGGADGAGTVFSLSVGLGPFVETLPASGKVGAKVIILGNNLTGTTSVRFNGTAAAFTVVKSTEITATVPTGATTGKVKVTTPNQALESNVAFRVTQ